MPRGRIKSKHPKILYSFRLSSAPETAREKAALDDWIAEEIPKTPNGEPAIATERIVLGLIRHYMNLEAAPGTPITGGAAIDLEAIKNELRGDMRAWLAELVADPERFAMLEQARETVAESDGDFDLDILDNILDDFEGRQTGDD